jgi:protein SCO1/2
MYNINKIFGMLCLLILVLSCKNKEEKISIVEELPYYNEASFMPQWLTPNSIRVEAFHKIPGFSLTDQDGTTITEKTFENKIYVADFFFTTCPGICLKMTANMSVLQDEFKEDADVLLLSHSVTPKADSVAVLKKYALENGVISKKWHLVTGERSEIYDLGRNSYFVEEDLGETKTDEDFLHTENFVLIDKNKHIRGIYNGLNKTAIRQLIADIQTLKTEN